MNDLIHSWGINMWKLLLCMGGIYSIIILLSHPVLAFKKNKKKVYKGYTKAMVAVIFRCIPQIGALIL